MPKKVQEKTQQQGLISRGKVLTLTSEFIFRNYIRSLSQLVLLKNYRK